MGGSIGMQLALRQHPLVRHLVLTGTSGGVPMSRFNAADWREEYRREAPENPDWFVNNGIDLSKRVANLPIPTLLVFGKRDSVAPISIGRYLEQLIPDARLVEIDTDSHFFVRDMPEIVAPQIEAFLAT